MKLSYRDTIGLVIVEVDPYSGIMFLGDDVYFTDTKGRDYKLPVNSLVMIG